MKATRIKMKPGCGKSNDLLEIDSIYLIGTKNDGFYKKEAVYDYLAKEHGEIQVDIYPYPNLIPAIGPAPNYEKYVKSKPDNTDKDNLLNLPRLMIIE